MNIDKVLVKASAGNQITMIKWVACIWAPQDNQWKAINTNLKSTGSRHLSKVDFCLLSHAFQAPCDQIQTTKSLKEELKKQTSNNDTNVARITNVRNKTKRPEIQPKSIRIRLRRPRCLFYCTHAPPGCSQAATIISKNPKMEVSGLTQFGQQMLTASASEVRFIWRSDLKTNIQKSASQHMHINSEKLKPNSDKPTSQQPRGRRHGRNLEITLMPNYYEPGE